MSQVTPLTFPIIATGTPAQAEPPTKPTDKKPATTETFGKLGTEAGKPKTSIFFGVDFTLISKPLKNLKAELQKRKDSGETLSGIEQSLLNDRTGIQYAGIMEHLNEPITKIPPTNRKEVQVQGIHVSKEAKGKLPEEIVKGLESGTLNFDDLTEEQKNAIVVDLKQENISLLPTGKKERDFRAGFLPDGKVFTYLYFPEHAFSKLGVPTVIDTEDSRKVQENIDPASLKTVYFRLPEDDKIHKGHYVEVTETAGPKGDGGANGAITPGNLPVELINTHSRGKKDGEAFIFKAGN